MKLEEMKFYLRKKNSAILLSEKKREMQEWASSNGAVIRQKSGRQETTIARSRTLSKNAYYEELKPISNVDKEYTGEHESDSKILLYDSNEARVESEETSNEGSLNLERVFETSNENSFLTP